MPRYFFNTQDGEAVTDSEGVELPDIATAQMDAVKLLGALLRDHAEQFWASRTFAVTVTDEDGRPVLTVVTAGVRMPSHFHLIDAQEG